MPDSVQLALLTDLRKHAGISLRRMADACGMPGTAGRDSVRAWELGTSTPQPARRLKFAAYLLDTVGLRRHPEQFEEVWDVLCDEWGWYPLTPTERTWLAVTPMTTVETPRVQRGQRRVLGDGELPNPAPLPPGSRMP